jgi:hypothetical protein
VKVKEDDEQESGQAVVVERASRERRRRARDATVEHRTPHAVRIRIAFAGPTRSSPSPAPRSSPARCSSPTPAGATVPGAMTAKQQLRQLVDELSEVEAAEALDILAARRRRDSLTELLDNAPFDDEPTTPEEDALVQEARDEIARGELISADEIRREFG